MAYQEPEFLPWDGRRVPITFVAGYLGAGKTTAINELLAVTDRPVAVLVNDVGEINIDAALIARRHGDTVELTDGCVCCSLIDGFGAAFDQLRARDTPPDHVVVELSGVADPDRMTPWGDSAGFVLDGVVVVVAADQLCSATLPDTARAAIESQVAKADLVVLTKMDLLDTDAQATCRRRLASLTPTTPIFESSAAEPATGRFLALGGRRPDGVAATATPSLFDAHAVTTVPFGPLESFEDIHDALDAALDAVAGAEAGARPATVVRAKGIVATADRGLQLVQVVGARREVTPLPMAELAAPTALTVITIS